MFRAKVARADLDSAEMPPVFTGSKAAAPRHRDCL